MNAPLPASAMSTKPTPSLAELEEKFRAHLRKAAEARATALACTPRLNWRLYFTAGGADFDTARDAAWDTAHNEIAHAREVEKQIRRMV